MTWIRTDARYLDQLDPRVWSNIAEAFDDDGIGVVEWLNIDTGTRLLLFAGGTWKSGGRFHLWWTNPAGGRVVELDQQLIAPQYPAGEASYWHDVKVRLVHEVEVKLEY